ncbi:MAG: hypothetical protein V3U35_03520 [Candidatus Neomarinimicrobiota bacterium]
MSRDARVLISRMIVVLVFVSSLLALVLASFFVTVITVSGGLILWLLYLLAAGLGATSGQPEPSPSIGQSLSKVVAGLGGVLALSALRSYGLEQTIWGGYTVSVSGVALSLALLVLMLMPLVIMQLTRRPAALATPVTGEQQATPADAAPPSPQLVAPEQLAAEGAPYPQVYYPFEADEELLYEDEEGEWDDEDEAEYYDEEEGDEEEEENEDDSEDR